MRDKENRKIQQYRGKWCVVWRENGQTKRHSLRTEDRGEAERNFQEYLRQLENTGDTVNDIIDQWVRDKSNLKSIDNAIIRLKHIRNHFGNLYPDQINRSICRDYAAFRKVSNTTVRNELVLLRCAVRWKDKNTNAVFEIPSPNPPRDVRITKDEYKTLLEAAHSQHIHMFIILAIGTAARVTALLELTWDRVDFEKRLINLTNADHKNKKRALVPMTNNVYHALKEAYQIRTCNYVVEYGSKQIKEIKKGFKNTAIQAGMPHVTPHVLRHSAATWMAEGGIPMTEIAQYLGHTNPNITYKVYARYSPDYLRDAASILDV